MIETIIKEKKEYFIIIVVLIVVTLLIYVLANINNFKKIDVSKEIVYTKEEINLKKYTHSKLPFFNLKGDFYIGLNNQMKEQYEEAVLDGNTKIDYSYYTSKNIVSLVIKTYHVGVTDTVHPEYTIYNIDIKRDKELSNGELLNQFDLTPDVIKKMVDDKMREYYRTEVDNQLFPEYLCDFNCFMEGFGLDKIDYVQEGKIYISDEKTIKIYIKFRLDQYLSEDYNAPIEPNVFEIKIK